ncbi:MAG: radical SAM protein [Bacteroidales bacterium]|nr:radical SAM protein [Bacteroidales bacterium]
MLFYPIKYDEPLFRPPSEGRSLIIQVTLGCSWNQCAFCEMYTGKQFHARKEEDVFRDIDAFIPYANQIRKVFLADGDPLVLSTDRLLRILSKLKATFPKLSRISTYASPGNLMRKSLAELQDLKDAGLSLLYVGIESGDDQVLENIQKGETFATTVEGLNKSKQAGMASSVMIINGVGGAGLSHQHALNSARVLNETQPKYASTLVLTHYKGLDHFQLRYKGTFTPMPIEALIEEMYTFLEATDLHETIFRSDHASNYLVIKGVLGKDKEKFLEQIRYVLENPGVAGLRNEEIRGF